MIKLYDYWRSSAAFRVRIALNIKGIAYDRVPVDIAPGRNAQMSEDYRRLNPQMRVPSVEWEGKISGQSMAIIEWLEETVPEPALLPADPWERLRVRAFADTIASDIHPLNNLSALAALRHEFGASEEDVRRWYHEWVVRGFTALEAIACETESGALAFGDRPTIADVTLVPQMWNARRFEVNLSPFPRLVAIEQASLRLEAFQRALPENQPQP
jgi:maleylpyruvate isomerase